MSLLADLTLSYEILADDPIEVGIHYGKSILQVLSTKLSVQPAAVAPRRPSFYHKQATVTSRPLRNRAAKKRTIDSNVLSRSDYASYTSRRSAEYTETRNYTARTLVGAI